MRTANAQKRILGLMLAAVTSTAAPARAWRALPAPPAAPSGGGAPTPGAAPRTVAPPISLTPAGPPPTAPDGPDPAAAVRGGAPSEAETNTPAEPASTGLVPLPQAAPEETFIALPPRPANERAFRAKQLKMTVGVPPTTGDLGSEADTLNPAVSIGENARTVALSENWSFVLKGYLRAPMRLSYGQTDRSTELERATAPKEWHSPPRMYGASSSSWAYINITPNPTGSLRATVSNNHVAATLILSTNTFSDVGYEDLDSTGGISQGFVTLKFPDTFGQRGGLAWTVGAFGNRYGYAGQNQVNAGYYGTYLFGRTRVVGETLTANFDLTSHWELLVEHGFGAELDTIPLLGASLPKQMFVPGDPNKVLGSNYVHHAHVALWNDSWLKIAAHYLTSWSPNEAAGGILAVPQEARLSVTGVEVHLDHPKWGNGFLGFSHAWGHNLLSLNDGLQVIHGGRGYDFKLQYFGNKLRAFDGSSGFLPNDGGRVETILFQHKFFSNALLGRPLKSRGFMLGLYGMYSHAYSPPTVAAQEIVFLDARTQQVQARFGKSRGVNQVADFPSFSDNKLKYGVDLVFAALRNVSLGFRYDRVQPTAFDPSPSNPTGNCSNFWSPLDRSCQTSYTAITPYVWIQPDWNSTRRVTISYTRFFTGTHNYPDSPYSALQHVGDPNLFMISALMSL